MVHYINAARILKSEFQDTEDGDGYFSDWAKKSARTLRTVGSVTATTQDIQKRDAAPQRAAKEKERGRAAELCLFVEKF